MLAHVYSVHIPVLLVLVVQEIAIPVLMLLETLQILLVVAMMDIMTMEVATLYVYLVTIHVKNVMVQHQFVLDVLWETIEEVSQIVLVMMDFMITELFAQPVNIHALNAQERIHVQNVWYLFQ